MNLIVLKLIFAGSISFLVTFYLVPYLCTVAFKMGVLDLPDGKVKKHEKATPYLGGVAVYAGFITSLALVFPFENHMFLFLVGTTLLLFVGLIDDLIETKPHQKLLGQVIAAFCFLKAGFHLKESFFLSNIGNIPVSLFWIILVINAFNLVDVMDGLATSLALFATSSFLIIALCFNNWSVALLLASFAGALGAFLWYNKPPARIYLGDAGSLFIGGFLATIPFLFSWGAYNSWGFITPFIILALPLLEVGTLIVVRTYKGIPFYQASPDHFSIYLKHNGWTIVQILGYVTVLSGVLSVASLVFLLNQVSPLALFGMGFLFLLIWFGALIKKIK